MASLDDVVVDETSPTYCTVEDVYRVLQRGEPGPTSTGESLSKSDVQEVILDMEDEVDAWTGQAWRARQVKEERPRISKRRNVERYTTFYLRHAPVRALNAGEGDKVEVWNGSTYEDYLSTQTEGRANDFYVNRSKGKLFVRPISVLRSDRGLLDRDDLVRVTYRYGHENVPRSVKRATALLTAATLVTGDAVSHGGFGGELDRIPNESKEGRWVAKAYTILNQHRGVSA